jgi:hypothetical protein
MSSVALLIVAAHIALVGVTPQPDEGAEVHVWQLLMLGQLPLMAYFGVRWVPPAPRLGLTVLLTQVAMALAAAAPVFLLGS